MLSSGCRTSLSGLRCQVQGVGVACYHLELLALALGQATVYCRPSDSPRDPARGSAPCLLPARGPPGVPGP